MPVAGHGDEKAGSGWLNGTTCPVGLTTAEPRISRPQSFIQPKPFRSSVRRAPTGVTPQLVHFRAMTST